MDGAVVIVLLVGVFAGVLGAAIRFGGMVELVAGYDPDRVVDEDELARFVGTNTLFVAASTIGVGLVEYALGGDGVGWYWWVYAVVVVALTGRLVLGARRFERPREG